MVPDHCGNDQGVVIRKSDAFGIRVRERELIHESLRGLRRYLRDLENPLPHLSGVLLHGPLRLPPRIKASLDRTDLTLDSSAGQIPCSAVLVFAVPRELSSANEILYLILQVEAGRGGVSGSVVEQA